MEEFSHDSFVKQVLAVTGAEHFLLFAGNNGVGQRLVLSSSLPDEAADELPLFEFSPRFHPVFSELEGRVSVFNPNPEDCPFFSFFPDSRWLLVGMGGSFQFSFFLFGKGKPPLPIVEDPLLSKSFMRRLENVTSTQADLQNAAAALACLSHEFKTPLVSIKGYAELILDHPDVPLSPKIQAWTRRIAAAANRLASLFRKATAESRSGVAWAYAPIPLDLDKWVKSSVHEAAQLAADRNIDWVCRVDEGLGKVLLDPNAAQDMLLELLQNAARATPDAGVVMVRVQRRKSEGVEGVLISVEDSGIGIPGDVSVERLFEKFTTLGDPMAHHSGDFEFGASGVGLGLSVVRGIVRAHGGKVWAEGRGQDLHTLPGAAFHVWFPVVNAHQCSLLAAGAGKDQRLESLLVIDSDAETSKILIASLSEHYNVTIANTAENGLYLWENDGPWEACLVEPMMLEENGRELISALNSIKNRNGSSIVVYTTADMEEVDELLALGADAIISKPARARNLLGKLKEAKKLKGRP